jgi:hypothetical protein
MRCTVDGLTPNRRAINRHVASGARAAMMARSILGLIDFGLPERGASRSASMHDLTVNANSRSDL